MANKTTKSKLVASLLSHSWRDSASPRQLSDDELAGITPLLLGSGAGALAWQRIRNSTLRESPAALDLQQAYKLRAVHASVFEDRIKKVITLLRSAHVDPVLIKGGRLLACTRTRLYVPMAMPISVSGDLSTLRQQTRAAFRHCELLFAWFS